jgi:ubiquinone/menaquinone biosynthesis C-methylase UbiE
MNWIEFYNNLAVNTKNKACQNGAMFAVDKKLYRKIFNDINGKMHFTTEDVVLDIGCGNGAIAEFIAPVVKKIILLDGAPKMLEFAKQTAKNFTNVEFRLADINKENDFTTLGNFDKIMCYSVAHYLDNYNRFEALLEEMINAIKPGGRILVGDIPLIDKREKYLQDRKKRIFLNFFSNIKYYVKKTATKLITAKTKPSADLKDNVSFNREKIMATIKKLQTENLNLSLVGQQRGLPFFNSREDLLIVKK